MTQQQMMMMEAVERTLLKAVSEGCVENSLEFASKNAAGGFDHKDLCSAIRSLSASGLVVAKEHATQVTVLTEEALGYVSQGSSPEAQVFAAVREAMPSGLTMSQLKDKVGGQVAGVGFKQAMQAKWVSVLKQDKPKPKQGEEEGGAAAAKKKEPKAEPTILASCESVEDKCLVLLQSVAKGEEVGPKDAQNLKKRKLIAVEKTNFFEVAKGPKFALERKKEATDLTRDLLTNDKYTSVAFKRYNFRAMAPELSGGHLHPLLKVRSQFRKIFIRMGFEEMPTNRFVESSFWNFDALFQPQQHPARDAHDTFFLTKPMFSDSAKWPADYLERVRKVHEEGGYGSLGYGYNWKLEEAQKNILRTHTTAVSSRMLYQVAKKMEREGKFTPCRYFSVDRVFRNESVDRTHLAEFHQCEGLVADKDLNLAHLLGTIKEFFSKIGMRDVKFKPAYNPYTEPSMEIFAFHPGLGEWLEVGNSGIFRPEMLRPMGLPEDVKVIAWGLSLERPTMTLYGVDNIRELFGHKVDLDMIKRNPLCRIGLD